MHCYTWLKQYVTIPLNLDLSSVNSVTHLLFELLVVYM